jgi:hypothetical protein
MPAAGCLGSSAGEAEEYVSQPVLGKDAVDHLLPRRWEVVKSNFE